MRRRPPSSRRTATLFPSPTLFRSQWPHLLAHATAASLSSGRGALICVPDGKDVARVSAALDEVLGPDQHVSLTADSGPAARYRDFLRVSRGAVRVVVGTRAAAYAPVHDLGRSEEHTSELQSLMRS